MAKKCISIASVKVEMYLCGIDGSWLDTSFLGHRSLIGSTTDIAKLQKSGIQAIIIGTERGLDDVSAAEDENQEEPPDSIPETTLEDNAKKLIASEVERIHHLSDEVKGVSLSGELTAIKQTPQYMLEGVQDILETLSKAGGLAIAEVNDITRSIMAETLDHEEAHIELVRTRDFSPALHEHALAVSTLSVLLARSIGSEDSVCQDMASAGLLS